MGKKGLHQTALSQHLNSLGASKEEVRSITETIMNLIEKAKDKQEEMGDRDGGRKFLNEVEMISALKKVEIKFQELVENRKVFQFFDDTSLKQHEATIKQIKNTQKIQMMQEKMTMEQERNKAKMQERIDAKQKLVVSKNIRDTMRSRKPDLVKVKTDNTKVPPEVEEMRRYLGIVPDDWNIAAAQPEESKKKEQPEAATGN